MATTNMQVVDDIFAGRSPNGGIIDKIYDILEAPFDALGLMGSPGKRFLFGTVVGGGLMYAFKPSFAFSGNDAKPWAVTNPAAHNKTPIPWFLPAFALGLFSGLLI